ncbi:MAG: hypothetical protein J6B89_04620 [Bacilli bacterium]|nr:hypothetical protein [Bacilli bacterium]
MKRKINKKNYKLILITTIFIIFIGMGLGFSYLNTSLSINGVVTVNRPKELLMTKIAEQAVLDNIASKYVTSETGIDFGQISSDTNGKGVYLLSSTKGEENPIYYYRGEVDNNNVKFANFCWKIVRTTDTGGIKLIYNGLPDSNGYCTNTIGEETQIGRSVFNTSEDDNTYVGYMYGTAGSTSYEETHKNDHDSKIKEVIDEWYKDNIISYTEKLEDTVWCNDRSVVTNSDYTGDGTGTTKTMYGAGGRLDLNKTPSLECKNINDRFTVDSANGNGKLTYPVALLTVDEVAYAGGMYYGMNNSKYYLHTGRYYWLLSPHYFQISALESVVISYGNIVHYNNNEDTIGVRPSISLKSGTTISDGDGTSTSPYIISN